MPSSEPATDRTHAAYSDCSSVSPNAVPIARLAPAVVPIVVLVVRASPTPPTLPATLLRLDNARQEDAMLGQSLAFPIPSPPGLDGNVRDYPATSEAACGSR